MSSGKRATRLGHAGELDPHSNADEGRAQEVSARFPIVGIGASAGGLAAFEAFFSGMPAGTHSGMAFVLVQHLAPDHKSLLTELVKRYTPMEVFEVEDGMAVRANCAYIIPPNRDMAFLNGSLQLLEPAAPRGQRLPIDFFFKSLAQDQHERAICIVLSGSGSDGTEGVRAVKAEGGMAMAQSPESTEYDSMPRSAIATGLIDYTLPPAEMPAQLIAYSTHAFLKPRVATAPQGKDEDAIKKILILLRAQTSHDFSQYKKSTVTRRIERRMAVQQIEQLDGYLRHLQETPPEIDALFRDLLIGVTSFFRDAEAFEALQQRLTTLLAAKPAGSLIRVWTPGCSTGEEAYSVAIVLKERIEAARHGLKLQMFATDLDKRAIDAARVGLYSASVVADLSPERLSRWFTADGGSYRIQKSIRDALVFSEHDVIRDPPFSKLDLITCRNLLIYMDAELQRRLVPLFHYALNPSGLLFLGSSESTGDFGDLFTSLDRKHKIYQRKPEELGTNRARLGEFLPRRSASADPPHPEPNAARSQEPSLRQLAEKALLRHAPVGALINAQGDLLYLHGHTGKYLEPAPGEAGLNIVKMAREGLQHPLASALHKAASSGEAVSRRALRVKTNGDYTTVHLAVEPVSPGPGGNMAREASSFLVTFEDAVPAEEVSGPLQAAASEAGSEESQRATLDERFAALQGELRAKNETLESTQEQMQTANEELKSSNEELQSTNEELQSTNEELETSKEELQSVNEELATVNAELHAKVTDLSRANNDMNNLLAGTGIGTIFVDHQCNIQRFTPASTQIIHLIRSDVGRPLSHIASNLVGYDSLIADVLDVLDVLTPKEVEVKTSSGAWFLLRIRPYRTLENVIEGAVITFTEITELKQAQTAVREANNLRGMAAVVRDAHDAITVQDLEGRILAWNRGAERMYGFSEAEATTMNIRNLIPAGEREEALAVVRRLTQSEVLEPYRSRRVVKNGGVVEVTLTASALVNESGEVYALSTTEREAKEPARART